MDVKYMDVLLTIAVPVKETYSCLESIIKKIVDMNITDLELVIQDNTKNNNMILEILSKYDCSNINYFNTKEPIPMTENFNRAIANSKGMYICMLGADDNVTSYIYSVAKFLKNNNFDSAIFHKATYYWPGMIFKAHQKRPNLVVPKFSGEYSMIDIKREFDELLKKGATSLGKLPQPYHGIVKKESLDKVFSITGTYVPGACPDMAMAVALAHTVSNHIYIDAPIAFSGQSYSSNGGKGARGEHKGKLNEISFLPADIDKNWPEKLPKIWTGPTIYADSAYNALLKIGEKNKTEKLSYSANYAHLISFYPEYFKMTLPYILKNWYKFGVVVYWILRIFIVRCFIFLKNTIQIKFNYFQKNIYYNILDSYDASKIIDETLYDDSSKLKYLFDGFLLKNNNNLLK